MTSLVRNICLEKTRWFYWQNSENWFSNWWLNLISKSSTFKIAFFCFLSKLFHCKASLLLRNVCHLNSVKMLDFEQFDQASILMVKTMICRIIWRNLGSYFNFNDSIADLTSEIVEMTLVVSRFHFLRVGSRISELRVIMTQCRKTKVVSTISAWHWALSWSWNYQCWVFQSANQR